MLTLKLLANSSLGIHGLGLDGTGAGGVFAEVLGGDANGLVLTGVVAFHFGVLGRVFAEV